MDREELKNRLINFQVACAADGKPLLDMCLEEAFPGDDSTSFILQVKAPWMDTLGCSPILRYLTNKLFETTDFETRMQIFFIKVLDTEDKTHCFQNIALKENKINIQAVPA